MIIKPIGRIRYAPEPGPDPGSEDRYLRQMHEWANRQFRQISDAIEQVDQLDVFEAPQSDSGFVPLPGMIRYFEDNSKGFGPGPYCYCYGPDGLGNTTYRWAPLFADGLSTDDLRTGATAINPPGLSSDPTFNTAEGYWEFADSKTELLFITPQISHGYVEGSDIRPHIHWIQTAAGSPLWRLSYKWYNNGEAYPASFTDLDSDGEIFTYTSGNLAQVSTFPSIDGTGKKISSLLSIKLQRIGGDAADTLNGATAKLTDFDIHVVENYRGSVEEYSKYS